MFGGIIQDVIAGLFFLVCFAVVVGLLFLLVRFLLVATKAAEVYIARNQAGAPAETVQPVTTATDTTPAATTPVRATPAPRTRTPKTPPIL